MNIPNAIKPANIDIRQYRKGDNLDKLDLTGDESDPLHVDEFFKTKAIAYQDNQLCSIWSVLYDDRVFYINHDCNEKNKIAKNGKSDEAPNMSSYPAALLGQMGVDKQFRNMGKGSSIIGFVTGLSRQIGNKIACRYVILQTNEDKVKLYASHQFERYPTGSDTGKMIMMHKKLYA